MYNIEDILYKLEENTKDIENSYSKLQATIDDNNINLKEQANKIESLNNVILTNNTTIRTLQNTIDYKDATILELQNTITLLQDKCNKGNNNVDLGLLGDMKNIVWISQNGCTYAIQNENIVVSGIMRYANISYTYKELTENYVANVKTKYNLHIEGYVVEGCSNGYLCSTSNLIEKTFNKDILLVGSWQRTVVISIFLSQSTGEDSQLVITALKLTLA